MNVVGSFALGALVTTVWRRPGRWRMALANVVLNLVLGGAAVAAYLVVSLVLGTDRYQP